jgi:putative transposase
MSNHFHMLVEDASGRLSEAMRQLSAAYSRHLNKRLGRDGPVFRGRFKSRVITDELYLGVSIRYIHRNPVDAGLVGEPADWRWSSHRFHHGAEAPPWLSIRPVLARFGDDPARFDRFVKGPDPRDAATPTSVT